MSMLVSAFPGTGKSTIFRGDKDELNLVRCHITVDNLGEVQVDIPAVEKPEEVCYVYDSDSSHFPKDNFPANYVQHIKETLGRHKKVIMLISSHEEVRNALRENDLPYELVYPNQALKDEYLERYTQRGSPEGFIRLMDDRWEQFILSCVSDPSPEVCKHELKAGEGVLDAIRIHLDDLCKGEAKVEELKDPQVRVETITIPLEPTTPARSEVKELIATAEADLETTSDLLKEDGKVEGNEGVDRRQPMFDGMVIYAKEQYGYEMTGDVAGCERFMEMLRGAVKKAKEYMSGGTDKRDLVQVKHELNDAGKAVKVYTSSTWLDAQTYKEGLVKVPGVPAVFEKVTDPRNIVSMVDGYAEKTLKQVFANNKASQQRLVAGLKLYNEYKNKPYTLDDEDELVEKINKLGVEKYQKPEGFAGPLKDTKVHRFHELPALGKDGIKTAAGMIAHYFEIYGKMVGSQEEILEKGLSYIDDIIGNNFWGEWVVRFAGHPTHLALIRCIDFENMTPENNALISEFEEIMFTIVKFLENWILYSVE